MKLKLYMHMIITAFIIAYITKKIFKLNDVKIVSHIHSCYPFIKKNSFNKLIDSIIRKKYDYNILCGNFVFDFYENNTNYFKECKSSIIPNSIDVDQIIIEKNNYDNINEVRKQFEIPKDKKILGFVGRLCDIKGIVPFIEELSLVKEKFNDCKFLLIGDG